MKRLLCIILAMCFVCPLIPAFAAEIKERNLDVKLSLAESGCISDDTMNYIDAIAENEEIMEVLGREESVNRIRAAIALLEAR